MSPLGSGLSLNGEKWGVLISRKQRSDFGWFCLIFKKIVQLILRALLLQKKIEKLVDETEGKTRKRINKTKDWEKIIANTVLGL